MSLFDVDVTIKASPKTPAALDVCQGLFGACALFLSAKEFRAAPGTASLASFCDYDFGREPPS